MMLTRSALPQRSPMPLIVPCTCIAPLGHGGQGVGHRHVAVVVAVDAEVGARGRGATCVHAGGDLLGQRAAVGVAQDEHDAPASWAARSVCRA